MNRTLLSFFALAAVAALYAFGTAAASTDTTSAELPDRTFEFTYSVEIPAAPAGQGPVDVFIPLAQSDDNQEVKKREITASVPGAEKTEKEHNNLFWHGHVDRSDGKPITVRVSYLVERKVNRVDGLEDFEELQYSKEDLEGEEKNLRGTARMPVSGELIDKVRKDVPKPKSDTPIGKARAIYDYVVDTMEYKKVGTGWGNGDTYWACSQRYGNCTDFHALFLSLARAEKIPSKFEIGFPIPEDSPEGPIGGYHCWVTFKLPGFGWAPIDASEAKKHPEKRDLLFGTHPADRIKFSEGRELQLGEGHTTGPLNYFIYPHVEVGKKQAQDLKTTFTYKHRS